MREQTEVHAIQDQEDKGLDGAISILKNKSPELQLQLLEEVTQTLRAKEDAKGKDFVNDIRKETQDFQYSVGEKNSAYLEVRFKQPNLDWVIYNKFINLYVDKQSDNFWGVMFKKDCVDFDLLKKFEGKVNMEPIAVLINALRHAVDRYLLIRSNLSEHLKKDYPPFSFPIEITEQYNFTSSFFGGDLIGIGAKYLYELIERILANDVERYHTILYSIESQYFHEQIHHLNDEDDLDNGTREEMTLLGEFLYNPLHNQDRNKMFSQISQFVLNEEETKKEGKWESFYHEPFRDVVLKILLHGLWGKGIIQSSLNRKELEIILPNLHLYYSLFTEDERDKLLKKHVVMKNEDLYALMDDYTKEMGLIF